MRRALAWLAIVAATLACAEFSTDPDAPVAIELLPADLPSLVRGDTLRDTLGLVAPLVARAINSENDVIAGAPITFIVLDTGRVTLDPQLGIVAGRDTGTVRVVASVGSLQSAPLTLVVTLRPDTITPLTPLRDSVEFLIGRDTRLDLRVRVGHDTTPGTPGDATAPVRSYPVRFRIVSPAGLPTNDTTIVYLANDNLRPSTLDTTDASGEAKRTVRLSPTVRTAPPDSIIVHAEAFRPDRSAVPGSPVRFVVRIGL